MNGIIVKSLFFVSAILVNSSPAWAAEYLVKYRSPWALQSMNFNGLNVMDNHPAGQLFKVDIPSHQKVATLVRLLADSNIEYVVPNARLHTFDAPFDAQALKDQYAIKKVKAEEAWTKAGNKGSKNITVAVIDTGVDYRHKNLAPNMVPGYDFARNDNDPMDQTSSQNPGHGTHCAGIVGATGLVDGGIVGLAPGVSIMPIRFLDENGSGDLNNGVKAIDFAIEKKVQVISASWGAAIPRSQAGPILEAIGRAEKAGIIFIAAAANDGKNNDSYEVYPANAGLSNVITVAASNSSDSKPSWSNYGRAKVSLSSPGDAIMSTLPGDKYGNLSGTSMATPLVSGLVGFLLSQDPTITPENMKALLQSTGVKVGIQTACDCRVDALAAVETIMSKKLFVSPNAATMGTSDKVKFTGVYGTAPYKFASSNAAVASIDANGELTGVSEGETTVTVTDAAGATATSYKIYVGKPSSNPPPGEPGQPGQPGNPGDCPLGDPAICQIICQIQPDLPFCSGN
ncbi:MAG: S8 family serine peptidase [Bdellovibrionaceae bacterium]|nr:S8 family serine peptidase [Pseudobdellovibrionaceae bacterium]